MKAASTVRVYRPTLLPSGRPYGWGTVSEVATDLDGNPLAFVRWSGSTGCAGGWYVVGDNWTVENAVELARITRAATGG